MLIAFAGSLLHHVFLPSCLPLNVPLPEISLQSSGYLKDAWCLPVGRDGFFGTFQFQEGRVYIREPFPMLL